MAKRIIWQYKRYNPKGFIIGIRLIGHVFAVWLGYGQPIWWKPRFSGKGNADHGFGFGWLLICFMINVFKIQKIK